MSDTYHHRNRRVDPRHIRMPGRRVAVASETEPVASLPEKEIPSEPYRAKDISVMHNGASGRDDIMMTIDLPGQRYQIRLGSYDPNQGYAFYSAATQFFVGEKKTRGLMSFHTHGETLDARTIEEEVLPFRKAGLGLKPETVYKEYPDLPDRSSQMIPITSYEEPEGYFRPTVDPLLLADDTSYTPGDLGVLIEVKRPRRHHVEEAAGEATLNRLCAGTFFEGDPDAFLPDGIFPEYMYETREEPLDPIVHEPDPTKLAKSTLLSLDTSIPEKGKKNKPKVISFK